MEQVKVYILNIYAMLPSGLHQGILSGQEGYTISYNLHDR